MPRRMWLLIALAAAAPVRGQEFQSWNEVDLAATWHRVDLLAPFVARTDPSLPNPQLAATGLTADFHLPGHLTLTSGYFFADLPQTPYRVHLPLIALTASLNARGLTIADRNRLEKIFDYPTAPVRYRNRLLFDLPVHHAHIFFNDEVFFNLTAQNFNQNRLQAGAGTRLSGHLNLDLYFLQKNPASGAATHVLGSTLRITLTHRSPNPSGRGASATNLFRLSACPPG